jgi:hypothetical protein
MAREAGAVAHEVCDRAFRGRKGVRELPVGKNRRNFGPPRDLWGEACVGY